MQGNRFTARVRSLTYILFIFVVLGVVVAVTPRLTLAEVEHLDIRDHQDTAYLPLSLTYKKHSSHGNDHVTTYHRAALLKPPGAPGGPVIIAVGNSSKYSDSPATFARHGEDINAYVDEDPVYLNITDLNVYDDRVVGLRAAIAGGFARDSAWLIRFFPEQEKAPDRFLLATGADTTGDGIWQPQVYVLEATDYDLDGITEAFVYLSTARDIGPRTLYCIELENLALEWHLEVASELEHHRHQNFVVCPDSSEPRILFVTHAPLQGRTDTHYDDRYKYLSIIDGSGDVVFNRIIMYVPQESHLIRHPQLEQVWVSHVQSLGTEDSVKTRRPMSVSRIDKSGAVIATASLDTSVQHMYFAPYDHPTSPCLFVHDRNGIVHVYDTSFNLIACSNPCQLGTYVTTIRIAGYDSVHVFSDGLYTRNYERIAAGSFGPAATWPFTYDSVGNVQTLLACRPGTIAVYSIETKPWWALLDTFYVRNKVYILTILSALVVGLILVNYYRRRTRRNLDLISRQKVELEEVHRQLKEAQAQIIAQEKYQQARDIAGGFAHEIRNALFPARSALAKLSSLVATGRPDPARVLKLSKFSDDAVSRAVNMTHMIADYTKLEQARRDEPTSLVSGVQTVIERYQDRIENQQVAIDWPQERDAIVSINPEHLEIILTNLVLNALDALTESASPRILIEWRIREGHAVITVTDNGSGIANEHVARIFDMFYSTRPTTGTGLGLSISQRIAQLYDGELKLATTSAQGTTFELQLRMHRND